MARRRGEAECVDDLNINTYWARTATAGVYPEAGTELYPLDISQRPSHSVPCSVARRPSPVARRPSPVARRPSPWR